MYNVYCGKLISKQRCRGNEIRCGPMLMCDWCEYRRQLLDYKRKITQKPHTLISCIKYKFPKLDYKTIVRVVYNAAPDLEMELRKYYISMYGFTLEDYRTINRLKRKNIIDYYYDPALANTPYWNRVLYISMVQGHTEKDLDRIQYINLEYGFNDDSTDVCRDITRRRTIYINSRLVQSIN